ncbi:MAG TPA: hypothetical protein VLF39_04115 [Candidatus Saccharimonadales bacterium]|nr:hypothetical protein [Candidatus Saccharimonadales bacterium]
MFSSQNLTIGGIISFGFSTWMYTKMMRSTSSDVRTAGTIAGVSFVVCYLLILGILALLPEWWNK